MEVQEFKVTEDQLTSHDLLHTCQWDIVLSQEAMDTLEPLNKKTNHH